MLTQTYLRNIISKKRKQHKILYCLNYLRKSNFNKQIALVHVCFGNCQHLLI